MSIFRYAVAQFYSGDDLDENLKILTHWAEKAKAANVQCLVTPENSNLNRNFFVNGKPCKEKAWEKSEPIDGRFVTGCQALAKRLGLYMVVGIDFRGDEKPTVLIGQFLFAPTGEILHVHHKTVLWDYEYTLFQHGKKQLSVVPTPIGRIAMHSCADQIVPDVPRELALNGAEVYCNSLNSRGPDEARSHIPCRAIENGVWHVASNTVGNPSNEGLLWPWTGGSQVIAPDGGILAHCDEEAEMMVWADICPARAGRKDGLVHLVPDIFAWRRPELYQLLSKPISEVPAAAAAMYGPVEKGSVADSLPAVKCAMMQLSFVHTRKATEWMCARQVSYASRRGAQIGLLPELFCFRRNEVAKNPTEAAEYSKHVESTLSALAREHNIWLATTLVEKDASNGSFYHTAFLWESGTGSVKGSYRKTHLSRDECNWATPGADLSHIFDCGEIGRLAFVIGDEMWLPEIARVLALGGTETILHPCDWDRREAPHCCAVERCSENRTHILSVARLDNTAREGSQVAFAGEFITEEPIPLMRYPQCQWQRYGVEEQLLVELKRREPYCKMMGFNLDVLATRQVELYKQTVAMDEAKPLAASPPLFQMQHCQRNGYH
jgi:predicted amidohydrolase